MILSSKASFRKKYYYTAFKYQLGCELHSNDLMDLYPEYYNLSRNPADHIKIGYALIVFYSVIEELGFDIRATTSNPSRISGRWNPLVLKDLEQRLNNAGIDSGQVLDWNLRSTPTKIERLRKSFTLDKSDWSSSYIRDSKIRLVDAIAYVHWMRSTIASHKLTDLIQSLSIYDVSNAYYLAQTLLLKSLDNK